MSGTISSPGTQYRSDWMVPWMLVFTRMSRSSRSGSGGTGVQFEDWQDLDVGFEAVLPEVQF